MFLKNKTINSWKEKNLHTFFSIFALKPGSGCLKISVIKL